MRAPPTRPQAPHHPETQACAAASSSGDSVACSNPPAYTCWCSMPSEQVLLYCMCNTQDSIELKKNRDPDHDLPNICSSRCFFCCTAHVTVRYASGRPLVLLLQCQKPKQQAAATMQSSKCSMHHPPVPSCHSASRTLPQVASTTQRSMNTCTACN